MLEVNTAAELSLGLDGSETRPHTVPDVPKRLCCISKPS